MNRQQDIGRIERLEKVVAENDRELFEHGGVYLVLADESHEFHYALKKAMKLAAQNSGHVGILSVIEEQGFQPWGRIADRVRMEQEDLAQKRLCDVAEFLYRIKGQVPVFYCEYGAKRDVITKVIKEDPAIKMLVLGESKGGANPLVKYFIDGGLHEVQIPLLVVPDRPDGA